MPPTSFILIALVEECPHSFGVLSVTDFRTYCVYSDAAVSSDRQYVGLSGTLSAIIYCSLCSPAIYKHLIISIYDSRKQTLPVCHGALWILKMLFHPVFNLPSGILEWRRTYKQSCLHTRAAAQRQIYHRRNCFSVSLFINTCNPLL